MGQKRWGGGILKTGLDIPCNYVGDFVHIVSIENLLQSWNEFIKGKRQRTDVQLFSENLLNNIVGLHQELVSKTYRHGAYHEFRINDPKPRIIHKPMVRDRLLHHAIYRQLYPFFDPTFIKDSYSCRKGKGTHKALNRFRDFSHKVSQNNTRTCWVLQCDIRQFFASIDQQTLLVICARKITDSDTMWLIGVTVGSFNTTKPGIGLPLGNLTSQLLVNIYLNEFDQFVKHQLRVRYYIRYADDFVLLSHNRLDLVNWLPTIRSFLQTRLNLSLHPNKVRIKTLASGVDFLGWVHFPAHRVLRTKTERRLFSALANNPSLETTASYLGLLKHGNSYKLLNSLGVTSQKDPGVYWNPKNINLKVEVRTS